MKQSQALVYFKVETSSYTNYELRELLGPNWETILNFWTFIDGLTTEQWNFIGKSSVTSTYDYSYDSFIQRAASEIAKSYFAAQLSTWKVARRKNVEMEARDVAILVTYELIAMHEVLNQGKSLFFIPLFENL